MRCTQDETAKTIVDAGAVYVLTVRANRPKPLAALKALPWKSVPLGSQSTQHGHGRRTVTRAGKKSIEVVYVITSATHHDARPAVLAGWVKSHWHIENELHWVRASPTTKTDPKSAPEPRPA